VPLQGKRSLFLGAVGAGARMKLVVNMVMGSMMGEAHNHIIQMMLGLLPLWLVWVLLVLLLLSRCCDMVNSSLMCECCSCLFVPAIGPAPAWQQLLLRSSTTATNSSHMLCCCCCLLNVLHPCRCLL
jgi:hypothetical protein